MTDTPSCPYCDGPTVPVIDPIRGSDRVLGTRCPECGTWMLGAEKEPI